jgi:hypothetical protein
MTRRTNGVARCDGDKAGSDGLRNSEVERDGKRSRRHEVDLDDVADEIASVADIDKDTLAVDELASAEDPQPRIVHASRRQRHELGQWRNVANPDAVQCHPDDARHVDDHEVRCARRVDESVWCARDRVDQCLRQCRESEGSRVNGRDCVKEVSARRSIASDDPQEDLAVGAFDEVADELARRAPLGMPASGAVKNPLLVAVSSPPAEVYVNELLPG